MTAEPAKIDAATGLTRVEAIPPAAEVCLAPHRDPIGEERVQEVHNRVHDTPFSLGLG